MQTYFVNLCFHGVEEFKVGKKISFPHYSFISLSMRLSGKTTPVYADSLVITGAYLITAVLVTVTRSSNNVSESLQHK